MEFAEALGTAASLSHCEVGLVTAPSRLVEEERLEHLVSRLRCLLVPRQPGIFLHTAGVTAYTLTRFTEVLNSFAANSSSAATAGGGGDRSRVALATVLGVCRLAVAPLPYLHALGMAASDVAVQFTAFLIGWFQTTSKAIGGFQGHHYTRFSLPPFLVVSRRPEVMQRLRQPANPDVFIEMDRDSLAEASTWLLSLGWLDKSMFESTWTALLAVCTPPSERPELEENPFANSKEVRDLLNLKCFNL